MGAVAQSENSMCATKIMTSLRAAAAVLLFSVSPFVVARENCEQLGIFDVYQQLLPPGVLRPGEAESVTLRYIPGDTSIERELELRIATTIAGKTTIEVLEPMKLSVQAQFTALDADLAERCDETVLYQIVMERRDVPSNIGIAIRRELMRARMQIKLEGDLYLDASRYEVWVKTPMNEVSWVLYGPDSGKETHPLINWSKAAIHSVRTGSARRR
jgi:hypothetical protein